MPAERDKVPPPRVRSLRSRLLALVWIPGIALMVVGLGVAGVVAKQGKDARDFGETRREQAQITGDVFALAELERLYSVRALTDPGADRTQLAAVRQKQTRAAARLQVLWSEGQGSAPEALRCSSDTQDSADVAATLATLRAGIDSGRMTAAEADTAYSTYIEMMLGSVGVFALSAPDNDLVPAQVLMSQILRTSERMAHAITLIDMASRPPGLTEAQYQQFVSLIGEYRVLLATMVAQLPPDEQRPAGAMTRTGAGMRLQAAASAILHATPTTRDGENRYRTELPFGRRTWDVQSVDLVTGMNRLFTQRATVSADEATDWGTQRLQRSLAGAAALVLLVFVVLFLSSRITNGLVRRLRGLRDRTLDLAESELPPVVERADEIGQVAAAFDLAQRTAVAAAASEAENRAGTGKVFLNIARRSQVIVHQQLRVLDRAERAQEDPDQLVLLFELDHLATRARRNAENLIILGGGQAGRQWRRPVPLLDLVRSAVGESERYTRVSTGPLPPILMDGAVVADLVHLLAELVDNATNFSPPTSRSEVRGNLVGRGVVIEIEDQGLGIEPQIRDELNEMLREPPEFSFMALSDEPRMGLFVVARLALRHGITVTLLDSPSYGGTKAVVLIPSESIADGAYVQPEITEDGERDVEHTVAIEVEPLDLPLPAVTPERETAPPDTSPTGLPIRRPASVFPDPPPSSSPASAFHGEATPDRPALPRRTRRTNLAPELLDEPATHRQDDASGAADADRARSRFAGL